MTAKYSLSPALLEGYARNFRQQWHNLTLPRSERHIVAQHLSSNSREHITGISPLHEHALKTQRATTRRQRPQMKLATRRLRQLNPLHQKNNNYAVQRVLMHYVVTLVGNWDIDKRPVHTPHAEGYCSMRQLTSKKCTTHKTRMA